MKVIVGLIEPDERRGRHAARHADRLYRAGGAGRHRRPRSRRCSPPTPSAPRCSTRARHCARSRPARRDPRAAERDRRLCRAGPRGAHPRRARLRRGDAAAPARQLFGRLADARRARRACCSPRPTCCCSTSRPTTSISRRRCGWRISCAAYRATIVVDQPRARPAQQRRRPHPPSRGRQDDALSRRL